MRTSRGAEKILIRTAPGEALDRRRWTGVQFPPSPPPHQLFRCGYAAVRFVRTAAAFMCASASLLLYGRSRPSLRATFLTGGSFRTSGMRVGGSRRRPSGIDFADHRHGSLRTFGFGSAKGAVTPDGAAVYVVTGRIPRHPYWSDASAHESRPRNGKGAVARSRRSSESVALSAGFG